MEKEKFNQAKYMREWQKENMKQVKASYKTEFVDEFKEACKKLGIKQSDVFRNAMYSTIKKAKEIKMTKGEIKQEIILDLKKRMKKKNGHALYLKYGTTSYKRYLFLQNLMIIFEGSIHFEYINNLENEIYFFIFKVRPILFKQRSI